MTNILARRRRSPEENSSLPSPLVGSWNGSSIESSTDDDAEYFNFYGEGNEPIEEEEDVDVNQQRDEIEGLPREVYCDLATTLRFKDCFLF